MEIKRYIKWEDFSPLIHRDAERIKDANKDIDTIICLARGGLIASSIISHILNVKRVYSFGINFYSSGNKLRKVPNIYQPLPDNFWSSNILIVDDIIDSAKSISYVVNLVSKRYYSDNPPITYATYFKENDLGFIPNYYGEKIINNEWVVFPWEPN